MVVENPKRRSILIWIATVLVLLIIGAVLYTVFQRPYADGPKTACMSQVKQLSLAMLMYADDNNHCAPDAYTFDLPANWDTLSDADKDRLHPSRKLKSQLLVYAKHEDTFLCPGDYNPPTGNVEGLAGVMSYVNPLNLRGYVTDFSNGGRVLYTNGIENPASVAYVRDPVRGSGKTKDEKPALFSPHAEIFAIGYLDGHVKADKVLDVSHHL
ncbi:MAG: hypothetical protein JST12_01285 [Armatimonadetes bacterium]|nr:hypothetical protein [Armatimonadota bacterium]MBS1728646.1 hypothetical protein [Armatimonadota bacterium]